MNVILREIRFNGQSQTACVYLHRARREELQNFTKVTKHAEKDALGESKVIQGHGHQIWHQSNGHVRLLLVTTSNFGNIKQFRSYTTTYWSKTG